MIVIEKDVDKFRRMESQIIGLETEWNNINSQFEMVIDKIPDNAPSTKQAKREVTEKSAISWKKVILLPIISLLTSVAETAAIIVGKIVKRFKPTKYES